MAQFSMEIMRLTGSVLRGNQHAPASEGITSLKDSIITLAGPILAVAIVIFAAWAGLTQRINWQVLITLVVVAFLMGVGPTAMTWMLNAFKAS